MADIRREGDPAFPDDTETDNSASSPEEKTEVEETVPSEQDKETDDNKETPDDKSDRGFADHPRFKELIEQKNDLKKKFNEQSEEIAKFREEMGKFAETAKSSSKASEPEEIPDWFAGDDRQWKEYSSYHKSLAENAKVEALKDFENKGASEKKRVEEATEYFQKQVNEIEAETGEKVDPNKLLKFVQENDLVDSQQRWNWKAGYKLLKAQSKTEPKKDTEERKKIASATTTNNRAEAKPSPYATPQDFKGKTWGNLR